MPCSLESASQVGGFIINFKFLFFHLGDCFIVRFSRLVVDVPLLSFLCFKFLFFHLGDCFIVRFSRLVVDVSLLYFLC